MKDKIALTGIKPTGIPHIGNYLGMIKPALDLVDRYQALYFIADYHALTTVRDGRKLREMTYDVAATWLALGLDPEDVVFFRQSDIPELFELTWILACFTGKGLLNRAHAYKASVDENLEANRDPDMGINIGLYTYPVLMAADILLYGSHVVPVGQDQRQHVEIARDIALAFNHNYGEVLVVPEALVRDEVATIPGLDGRKMSKNYDNLIPIFAPSNRLRKQVMRIVTDSRRPEEPKDPDQDNVFNIYKHFATAEAANEMRARYSAGGLAYSEVKSELYELLENRFGASRETYNTMLADTSHLEDVLLDGARKAREIGLPFLEGVRKAVGVRSNREIERI
jgi:tryptophanyl-tRNA synthetase